MKECKDAKQLIEFLSKNPSVYHVVSAMACGLAKNGAVELDEGKRFTLESGKTYYVRRNGSAIIAFRIPKGHFTSAHIIAAHTDSPTFRLKPNAQDTSTGRYSTLNVEVYGGLIGSSWFDRPLSIAGRAFVKTEKGIEERLVDFDRDLVCLANLAIHQNREVNEGVKLSWQKECKPILSTNVEKGLFEDLLAKELGVEKDKVLDADLFLYNRTPASIWGAEGEFFSSGRLDDLMCAHAAWRSFLEAEESDRLQIVSLFDNEEVGSGSRQGALSDFLVGTIERVLTALGYDSEERMMVKAKSRMLSADNGHALHPNYAEKCDITNKPVVNGGVIIKYSANQKYTTDGLMGAYVKDLMDRHSIPHQIFVNNSDVKGGSTLGNLSQSQYSLPTADIGLAQLAMHSSWESAGVEDAKHIKDLFSAFLED